MIELNLKRLKELKAQQTDISQFRKELNSLICHEIKALDAPNQKLIEAVEVISCLQFPLKISTYAEVSKVKARDIAGPVWGATLTGVTACRALRGLSVIPALGVSFSLAALVGIGIYYWAKPKNTQPIVQIKHSIDSTVEEIEQGVDKLVNLVSVLVLERKPALDKIYPNVLNWYQQAYADCEDYGVECAKHFQKRIKLVLTECGYTLHNYDGSNGKLFRQEKSNGIESVRQYMPAIVNESGYVLSGCVFLPQK